MVSTTVTLANNILEPPKSSAYASISNCKLEIFIPWYILNAIAYLTIASNAIYNNIGNSASPWINPTVVLNSLMRIQPTLTLYVSTLTHNSLITYLSINSFPNISKYL